MTPLEKAIEIAGGVGALASAIGVATSAPSMWKARRNVPAEHCPAIERATGGVVKCEELRPDVAWDVLREQAPAEPPKPIQKPKAQRAEPPPQSVEPTVAQKAAAEVHPLSNGESAMSDAARKLSGERRDDGQQYIGYRKQRSDDKPSRGRGEH